MKATSVSYKNIVDGSNILKPNYHLNYGKKRIDNAIKNNMVFSTLGELTTNVYTGGIFKRFFIEDKNYGLPYISAQHMMSSNPLGEAKLISKKYTPRQEDMTLRNTQILVSCAGTIGNVRLIGKDLEGIIGSQDIIRVIANDSKAPYGYIYAYLATPTAYNYMQSYIYGSVVPRIEPNTLSRLPIPLIDVTKQNEIHNLIVEASELRFQANNLLELIVKEIESTYIFKRNEKIFSLNIADIKKGDKHTVENRLESDFYQPATSYLTEQIKKDDWDYLGDLSLEINRSGLRERKFVENGIPLITGQNLNMARLQDLKKLSKKFTRNVEKNTTIESDILISVQGTIGKVEYVFHNMYQGVFASEQLSKIKINKEKIHPGYVYAFLKSKLGQSQLVKYKTGSVIEWIRENNIASVVIPIPKDKGQEIGNKINNISKLQNKAYENETLAINMIENEIESWQKS
jgi:type I restriction enzyme S subunit